MYVQSETHGHFHWRIIAVLTNSYCSDVCGYHRRPQTLTEICRNMVICDGFRAVAARGKYSGFVLFDHDNTKHNKTVVIFHGWPKFQAPRHFWYWVTPVKLKNNMFKFYFIDVVLRDAIGNKPTLVEIMFWCRMTTTIHYQDQRWPSLLTRVCATLPRWVKKIAQ